MPASEFVALLGLLLVVAFGAEQVFRWLRVPPVLVLMGCGVLVGPVLGWLPAESFLRVAPHFGAIAFLLILFEGGLDLDLDRALGVVRSASSLAAFGFALSAALAFGVALAFGWPWRDSLVLAVVIAPISGAILLPLLGRLAFPAPLRATLVLEAALADVLGVLALGLVAQAVDVGGLRTFVALGSILAAFSSVLAGLATGWIWPRAMRFLGGGAFVEVLTFGVALVLWGGISLIGASGVLAVFVFGFTLANSDEIRRALGVAEDAGGTIEARLAELHTFVAQTTFLVRAFFFVFIGVVVQVDALAGEPLALGLAASAVFLLARWLALDRAVTLDGSADAGAPKALLVLLQPRGLVTAVLAIEASQLPIERSSEILPLASVVIVATNLLMAAGLVTWGAPGPVRAEARG